MIVAKEIADHASWYNPSLWSYGDDVVRTLHGLTTKYPPDPTSNIQQLYPKSVWYTVNREHSNLIPHVCESLYIMIWVCSKTNGYQQKRWFIIITFLGRIVLFQLNPHIIWLVISVISHLHRHSYPHQSHWLTMFIGYMDTSTFAMVESTFLLILIDWIPEHFLVSFYSSYFPFIFHDQVTIIVVGYISLCWLCPIIHRPRYIAAHCVQVSWSTALPRAVERFFGTSRRRRGTGAGMAASPGVDPQKKSSFPESPCWVVYTPY